MADMIPRIMIAGTGSGCGKTTVSCALIKALHDTGLCIGTFKCGPDYIDPMFHKEITGRKGSNLDSFFFDDNTLKYLLVKNGAGNDINIIEGVMGFYDGILEKGLSLRGSTFEISEMTQTPVILTVNARGAAASVLAVIHGFLTYHPENHICGVIFNQCASSTYALLETEVKKQFTGRIKPLGYMPVMKDCTLESRHLGLVTAAETDGLEKILKRLGDEAAKSLDLDGIVRLSKNAGELEWKHPVQIPCRDMAQTDPDGFRQNGKEDTGSAAVKIGVALDRAFCFYYDDSLSLLKELGAQLVPFSPIADPELPEDIDGLYLGGGYPELYAAQLNGNASMLASVKKALSDHMPCIAECGGFMYLTKAIGDDPMTGFFDTVSYDTGKLSRFGYVTLTAQKDNMLCKEGEKIAAHEFHYWDTDNPGSDFLAVKPSGRSWNCVYANNHLYAGFPHFHFWSDPVFAVNFIKACKRHHNAGG